MFATFTMDRLAIAETRSLHNDTDIVHLSATVGADDPVFATKSLGDLNNGTHPVNLSLQVNIPDDDTTVVFAFTVRNAGHGGNPAKDEAAQSALSMISKEIIKQGAHGAEAVAIGSVTLPFVGSSLVALAGILGATELGLLLFGDCDGPVAWGAFPFTCSDLIRRTSSGRKITETANQKGSKSPGYCNRADSQYSTTCTIATAPSIRTVLDLGGEWEIGGVTGPFISVTGNSISIDMTALHRPAASGAVLDSTHISVHFPDDKDLHGCPPGAQCHQVVEQLELDESPGDRGGDRLERRVDEWWRPRPSHHGSRQLYLDRHVCAEASDGGWNGRQQLGISGKFSR